MIVAIQHYVDNGTEIYKPEVYQNVASVKYMYQWYNGDKGSYWLTLTFKKGTPEANDFHNGECSIELDPKCDNFQIYKENQ